MKELSECETFVTPLMMYTSCTGKCIEMSYVVPSLTIHITESQVSHMLISYLANAACFVQWWYIHQLPIKQEMFSSTYLFLRDTAISINVVGRKSKSL